MRGSMPRLAGLAVAASSGVGVALGLDVEVRRPAAESWKRTRCGGGGGDADIPTQWGLQVGPHATPLSAYPRPQMVRSAKQDTAGGAGDLAGLRDAGDADTWANLNGLWEWEKASSDEPPFGRALAGSILVPFPVESCLSGVAPSRSADIVEKMWYRLTFDYRGPTSGHTLLHFGAVDWQTTVYLNGRWLGNHTGAYDGFSFDVDLKQTGNELLVHVFDPSDSGVQPNGKQRISAIDNPGGDTYTPSSGIWQTVWLESAPSSYIMGLNIGQASTHSVTVEAVVSGVGKGAGEIEAQVLDRGSVVASGRGAVGEAIAIEVPSPKLWSPDSPHLYDLKVTAVTAGKFDKTTDTVLSYFGLRSFAVGQQAKGGDKSVLRPLLNDKFTFLAGFLDQSWWPDGQYAAPSDEALEYDLQATKMFGMNMIRLHQKVNPERWYYHADRLGLVIFQDMPQKYGHASPETIPFFVEDMKAMILGRGNHPCIVQWTTFNEDDCHGVFHTHPNDVKSITDLAKKLDPTRLVDTDSGGSANRRHIADVNDIHSYPYPGDPQPSSSQYAMVGEFGGIGAFTKGKEWVPGKCSTYLKASNGTAEALQYIDMASILQDRSSHISASVYTQTTDVELECDGFLNYDRSNKFTAADTRMIHDANQALINGGSVQIAGADAPAHVALDASAERTILV